MAAKVTYQINIPSLKREMEQGGNRSVVEAQATPLLQTFVDEAARELQAEFEAHPVTQELDGGINSSNSSGTLNGYGNLFSYIGFTRGDKPLQPIRAELAKKPKIKVSFVRGQFRVNMVGPSKQAIYDKTPLPWATDSWARRVEVGLAGFGYYLQKNSPSSRSTIAIQSKHQIRGGRFRNVSYMTQMFKRFYKKFGVKV